MCNSSMRMRLRMYNPKDSRWDKIEDGIYEEGIKCMYHDR